MLEDLFVEIEKAHVYELADNSSEIEEFEKQSGYKLPDDLKEFYHHYKTVRLFNDKGNWKYRFVPVSQIHITGLDIFGKYYENDGPKSWFTICDVMDGNYIAVDLLSEKDNQWNYIDCFHETYGIPGECAVIAKSFRDLLEHCLHGGNLNFYLEKDFHNYGDALEVTSETAIQRVEPARPKGGCLGKFIWQRKNPNIRAGWQVGFVKPSKGYYKFFADKEYGGKEKAFTAAKLYLEENKR